MSSAEQLTLDIITRVQSGKIKAKEAKRLLGKSSETLRRYCRAFEREGVLFVKHGNSGKTPWNKTPQEVQQQIEGLIRTRYFDVNACHLKELLSKNHGLEIGRDFLRRTLLRMGLLKKAHGRRRKPRMRRDRMPQRGLMIQMDGSPHPWFGDIKTCLIAAIDDATSEILYGEFFPVEDTLSCMKVVQKLIEKFGLFSVLYVDRAGIFSDTKRRDFGQLARACEDLNIQVVYAQSPEAKGRIERLFQTLQDRLCVEFRLNNIQRPEEANEYFQNVYMPKHNKKFSVMPQNSESAFKPCSQNNLEEHFCLKEWRRVAKDHTISWNSKTYTVTPPEQISIAGQQIEIRHYWSGGWKAFWAHRSISLQKLEPNITFAPSAYPVSNVAQWMNQSKNKNRQKFMKTPFPSVSA